MTKRFNLSLGRRQARAIRRAIAALEREHGTLLNDFDDHAPPLKRGDADLLDAIDMKLHAQGVFIEEEL